MQFVISLPLVNAASITLGGPLPGTRTATLSSAVSGATGSGNATVVDVQAAYNFGAVKVNAFTAKATAASGYTTVGTALTFPVAPTVFLADDAVPPRYTQVPWVPGTAVDFTAPDRTIHTASGYDVKFVSRVQSQGSNPPTAVGTTPRTEALAEYPSFLRVTVVVTITSSTLAPPTTTTTTTTIVATTGPGATVPPLPLATDTFTIVVDYGQVSANATWVIAP